MVWSIQLGIDEARDGKSSVFDWMRANERDRKREMQRQRMSEWVRKSAKKMARVEREYTAHTQFTYQPLIKMRNMCCNWLSWSALYACNRNANKNAIASRNEAANNDGAKMDATKWIKVNSRRKKNGKNEWMNERTNGLCSQSPPSSCAWTHGIK